MFLIRILTFVLIVLIIVNNNSNVIVFLYYWIVAQRGDHIKWWSSASHPSWAALQEERRQGEGGDSGDRSREEGEPETHQETQQKEQRKTRPQTQSKCSVSWLRTYICICTMFVCENTTNGSLCRKAQRMTKKQMPTQQWKTDRERDLLFSQRKACSLDKRWKSCAYHTLSRICHFKIYFNTYKAHYKCCILLNARYI